MLPKLKRGSSLARLYSDRLEQSNDLVDSSNDSQFLEALRSIELAARLNGSKKAIMIGITSALPGEGKSTLAAALAFHLAQRSGRVLLVDCDLRNAYLSRTICPQASCGLTEMARGTVSREDAVRNRQNGQTDNMNFLPARSEISGWTNDEVVDSDTMREVFETLRRQYDVILIDLPPLAPVVDARAVADLVDAYVLVVEWGKTNSDVVQHALRSARLVRDKLIGAVLNKVDFSSMRRYDRHLTQYYGDYFKDRRAALH
jgi:capsular exopolysaccharide synthesis family protein